MTDTPTRTQTLNGNLALYLAPLGPFMGVSGVPRPGFISVSLHQHRDGAHAALVQGQLEPEDAEAMGLALIQAAGTLRALRQEAEADQMAEEFDVLEADGARDAI